MSPLDISLQKAIAAGDLPEVRQLVRQGADINYLCGMRGTPLCAAVYADQLEIVDYLLRIKCDVNAKDYDGEPPLCLAIRLNRLIIAEKLLQRNTCDVNRADPVSGDYPIHITTKSKNVKLLDILIQKNCKLDIRNGSYKTALEIAITHGYDQVVKLLVESKCDLLIRNSENQTPLFLAISKNQPEIYDFILETMLRSLSDSSLNHSDGFGNTPLIHAIINDNDHAAYDLVKRGADVNVANTLGESPLFFACKRNNRNVASMLLQANFNEAEHLNSKSAMHEAIRVGSLSIVKLLIKHGVDLQRVCNFTDALTFALTSNKPHIADFLIESAEKREIQLSFDGYERKSHPLVAVAHCTSPGAFAQRQHILWLHDLFKFLAFIL